MFDKERFHNVLALSLGYERLINDKRITICVDDCDDPWVTLKFRGCPGIIRFKASGGPDAVEIGVLPELQKEINVFIEAVHQAYEKTCFSRFGIIS